MKRYAFKFEPLLFARQTREEQVQQELAREHVKLEALGAELTRIFEEYQQLGRNLSCGAVTVGELTTLNAYSAWLRERHEEAKESVRVQRKLVEEVTTRLARLHMDKEIVERFKDLDKAAYYDSMRKAETKQLDDMTLIRFASPFHKKTPTT